MMRKIYFLIGLMGCMILLVGMSCSRIQEKKDHRLAIDNLLQQSESCFKQGEYAETVDICKQIVGMIDSLAADDSLSLPLRRTFQLYGKTARKMQCLPEAVEYIDSIIQVDGRLNKRFSYDLLAVQAYLCQQSGLCERALNSAEAYLALPVPRDKRMQIETLGMVSGIYLYCGDEPMKSIELWEEVRDIYHNESGFSPNVGKILAQLAARYRDNGQYEKAVQINLEAIDFYRSNPTAPGKMMCFGEISNTYNFLEMYPEALQMNKEAIDVAIGDTAGLSNLYRFRSDIYGNMEQWDSAFYYLRAGEQASRAIGSTKGIYQNKLNELTTLYHFPDSALRRKSLMEELSRDSIRMPLYFKQTLNALMGQDLLQEGKKNLKALSLMAESADAFRNMGLINMEMNSLRCLMEHYVDLGMADELLKRFERYKDLCDTLSKAENQQQVAASYIKFDTERKKQRIELLSAQIALRTRTLYYNIGLSITLALLLISAIAYIWIRRRSHRVLMKANEIRLQSIIKNQQELNRKNEQLTEQITKIALTNDTETMLKLSCQNLLSREDENEFRQSFSRLYPGFLKKLREKYSVLSRTEELVIMLISLNYKNEEIALIMGINKMSVNVTRSRIRKKMIMEKTASLEEEVARLM